MTPGAQPASARLGTPAKLGLASACVRSSRHAGVDPPQSDIEHDVRPAATSGGATRSARHLRAPRIAMRGARMLSSCETSAPRATRRWSIGATVLFSHLRVSASRTLAESPLAAAPVLPESSP